MSPTIAISLDKSSLKVDFKLSESSPDFSLNSVNVSGGTLNFFGGFGDSFSAYFSPTAGSTADGIIAVESGAFTNALGNKNADGSDANNSVVIPAIKTTITPPTNVVAPKNSSPPTIEISFDTNNQKVNFKLSEYSPDFSLNSVNVSGGALKFFGGFGDSFSAIFIPTANSKTDGIVTVKSATFMDTFGNRNADGLDADNTVVIPVNKSGVVTNSIAIQPSSLAVQTTAANDLIEGSEGINSVLYAGMTSNYGVADNTNGITTIIDSVTNRSGTDTLINVERIKFSLPEPTAGVNSVALDVAPTQNAGSVYMLYKAAFNRAAEPDGMGYWLAQKDAGSNIVTNIAQGFVNSEEFIAKYGANPTNASYVEKLYQNVLGRSGDSGGIAYWNQQLDNGSVSKAAALAAFATLPEGASNVASLIANGIPYTEFVG